MSGADENEPALTQARMALAKWDNQDDYECRHDGTPHAARTQERRRAIYAGLGLTDEVGYGVHRTD